MRTGCHNKNMNTENTTQPPQPPRLCVFCILEEVLASSASVFVRLLGDLINCLVWVLLLILYQLNIWE